MRFPEEAVHEQGAVEAGHDHPRVVAGAVRRRADEGLENVCGRDEALDVAPLVGHDGDGQPRPLEGLDRPGRGRELRDDGRALKGLEQALVGAGARESVPGPGVLGRGHPKQAVEVAPGHGEPRVAALDDPAQVLLLRVVCVEPDDPGSGGHQLAHGRVVEAQRPAGQVPLLVLEDASARAPPSSRISTSCSLTGASPEGLTRSSRSTPFVEAPRNQTAGKARFESSLMGLATNEATTSGAPSARRLGTSSPIMRER